MVTLDIYCNRMLVGTLAEEKQSGVFTYLPNTNPANFVSLLMPVRHESYRWPGGIMPFFQMSLPEGLTRDLIREKTGLGADLSDTGLLTLVGSNTIGRIRAVPQGMRATFEHSELELAMLLASSDARAELFRHLKTGEIEGISESPRV